MKLSTKKIIALIITLLIITIPIAIIELENKHIINSIIGISVLKEIILIKE